MQLTTDMKLNFGRKAHRARVRLGLNQTQMAKKIGTTQATISRIESGKNLPRSVIYDKIEAVITEAYSSSEDDFSDIIYQVAQSQELRDLVIRVVREINV